MDNTQLHLIIRGKVQGVFFRASAKEKALSLGLRGWVKNTSEGAVETVVVGDEKAVQIYADWCKTGPKNAFVENVEAKHAASLQKYTDFSIVL